MVAGQAVGHGVKVGAKAVEMKAKAGAEAIAHGAEKIGKQRFFPIQI